MLNYLSALRIDGIFTCLSARKCCYGIFQEQGSENEIIRETIKHAYGFRVGAVKVMRLEVCGSKKTNWR